MYFLFERQKFILSTLEDNYCTGVFRIYPQNLELDILDSVGGMKQKEGCQSHQTNDTTPQKNDRKKDGRPLPKRTSVLGRAGQSSLAVKDNCPFEREDKESPFF